MAARQPYLLGPLTATGLVTAAVACVADQAVKLWLLFVFKLGDRGAVAIAPFVDLVLAWNTGISYGWFQQEGPLGQWALLALKVDRGGTDLDLARAGGIAADGGRRSASSSAARSAMPSTGWPTARWPISCCCTSKPPAGGSIGTCSILPMSPSLPGSQCCCMSRCSGTAPQKRPDPGDTAGRSCKMQHDSMGSLRG